MTEDGTRSPRPREPLALRCGFCGHPLRVVEVHGHGQCAVCGTNLQPCCDGETCGPVQQPIARDQRP